MALFVLVALIHRLTLGAVTTALRKPHVTNRRLYKSHGTLFLSFLTSNRTTELNVPFLIETVLNSTLG